MAENTFEFTGKSVDEAVAEGLAQLKVSRSEVAVEVLSKGSRGIFGLGSEPARTLFVDHLFRNVQGARAAGLHADTAWHAQSLRRVLRRYQLLG